MINLSDLDSRVIRTQGTPPRQAYNAQAAVNDRQVILPAEISIAGPDFGHLGPTLDTALVRLRGQGVRETAEVVLADALYWHTAQMQQISERGIEVPAPPDGNLRDGNVSPIRVHSRMGTWLRSAAAYGHDAARRRGRGHFRSVEPD